MKVELRKARKDEQILKRRNICFLAEASLSPEKDEKNVVGVCVCVARGVVVQIRRNAP